MRYDELPTEPPSYNQPEDSFELGRGSGDPLDAEVQMELMEVEEDGDRSRSFRQRVTGYREAFSRKIVEPVRENVLDPLAEGYIFLSRKWEAFLGRLGNPLIVKRFIYVICVGSILYFVLYSGLMPDDSSRVSGSFSDRQKLEEFATQSVDLKSMEENLEYLSSIDHIAGTAGDLSIARYVEAFLNGKGLSKVEFQELPATLNYPKNTTLRFGDTELDISQQFNPLSKGGAATGKLVYAYYGRVIDFEKLKSAKLEIQNAICLIKFGSIPISQKMLISESYGCSAVLFTSETDEFPDSCERRSVAIPEFYPGDPFTPGWSSYTPSHKTENPEVVMASIPSASLTWNQAKEFWKRLEDGGVQFDDGFLSGKLTFEVTLDNQVVYKEEHPVWNILAKIEGREQADHALIIGAQRDAPCKGAIYPDTGTVLLLELAQMFEKLRANFHWEPLRSIYFFSWDATEYNFAGAVELIEINMREVRKEGIVYLDLTDAIAGDHIEARGSPLLTSMLSGYEEEYNMTIGKQFEEYGNFVPFMGQGIPVLEVGYKGSSYPKYSCDDTFDYFQKSNMDPDFNKHRTLVELVLKIALRIVEDPLIPFDISGYVDEINSDFKDLQAYAAHVQPDSKYDFSPLIVSLLELKQLGKDLDMWRRAWAEIVDDDSGVEPSLLSVHRWSWNSRLSALEKFFLSNEGLPGRGWYKNPIFGPQMFKPDDLESSWWSFPAIRDAIYFGGDVQRQIIDTASLISEGCKFFVQG